MSASTPPSAIAGAQVVLAVKDLLHAKTRLAATVPAEHRAELVLAMLSDTLDAALHTPGVVAAHVVTRDKTVAATVRRRGGSVLADPPHEGLNHAFEHAADTLNAGPVIALQPDLPALRPAELGAALRAAARRGGRCFVADREGTGTTMLSCESIPLNARFGAASAEQHACSGAAALPGAWPGLRCDVDTIADLAAALLIGVGPATAAVLDHLGIAGTVQEHAEGIVIVRGDDGAALRCPEVAAQLGGWRQLRAGQRVRVHRDEQGEAVLLRTAVTRPPD